MVKVRDVMKVVQEDGWYLVSIEGDHRQYKHPTKRGKVTIAGRPSQDMPAGTLISVYRQAQIKRRK